MLGNHAVGLMAPQRAGRIVNIATWHWASSRRTTPGTPIAHTGASQPIEPPMTTPSLRVALVCARPFQADASAGAPLGDQRFDMAQMARVLAAAGHQVEVLARRDDPALPPVTRPWPGVRVQHLDAGPPCPARQDRLRAFMPAFAEAARQALHNRPPCDVLHADGYMAGWVGMALRLQLGLPLVTSFDALGLVGPDNQARDGRHLPVRIGIERALAQQSDRVIATCAQDAQALAQLYGAPPGRVRTVPEGVDLQLFRPGDPLAARQRLGLPAGGFLVLQFSRPDQPDALADTVEALALMAGRGDARLLLVGAGMADADGLPTAASSPLQALAAARGVARQVQFADRPCGPEALRDWYLAADVLVSGSPHGAVCDAALQAMACGCPVVRGCGGAAGDTLVDVATGLLLAPGDPLAMAARLDLLRANPGLGNVVGRAGLDRVARLHSWTQIGRQIADMHAELATARAATPPQDSAPWPWAGTAPWPARRPAMPAGAPRSGALPPARGPARSSGQAPAQARPPSAALVQALAQAPGGFLP